jgi:hypothetical protein
VKSFGRSLHSVQDSFAHMGIGPWKHYKLGEAPDKYCENNPRDQQMEITTKWLLTEFKKRLDSKRYKPFR